MPTEKPPQTDLPDPSIRRAIRVAAGWTLKDLAAALGCQHESQVSRWETGKLPPKPSTAARYRQVLAELAERVASQRPAKPEPKPAMRRAEPARRDLHGARRGRGLTDAERILLATDLDTATVAKLTGRHPKTIRQARHAMAEQGLTAWRPERGGGGKGGRNHFTAAELALVNSDLPAAEVAAALGRSAATIQSTRNKLVRAGRRSPARPQRQWTAAEVEMLRTDLTDDEVAARTGRSAASVTTKRWHLRKGQR